MNKFEHKVEIIVPFSKSSLLDITNKYGKEGWEVVGIYDGYILFKRKIEEETNLKMELLKEVYGVCRLEKDDEIPAWAFKGDFYSITKTDDELSIVCLEENISKEVKYEGQWRVLKVLGPLDFSLVGVIAKISSLMSNNKISIFTISTYDTDYILIKDKDIKNAVNIFKNSGYIIL